MTTMLTVELTSFSYKRPPPPHLFSCDNGRHGGGFVFDCRSLPNPGRDVRYKNSTGLHDDVKAYLREHEEVTTFFDSVSSLVCGAVENFLHRDFDFMSVAFGCTGGQHRSVYFCDELGRMLKQRYGDKISVVTIHATLTEKGFLSSSGSSDE